MRTMAFWIFSVVAGKDFSDMGYEARIRHQRRIDALKAEIEALAPEAESPPPAAPVPPGCPS